jgi:RecJ-like exonuclease
MSGFLIALAVALGGGALLGWSAAFARRRHAKPEERRADEMICPACSGRGAAGTPAVTCDICGGTGVVKR